MKNLFFFIIMGLVLGSCELPNQSVEIERERLNSIDWNNRRVDLSKLDSLENGKTYLSVYSEIYSVSEGQIRSLTATVSLRNIHESDTVYISRADYFDTSGALSRSYVSDAIFILPMETIEIVIGKVDRTGGTGGNFVFDWSMEKGSAKPIFEAVMLSITGTQGFSFVTRGWQSE